MTKPTSLISIIIPVFNTRECLSACLDSVVSQSYQRLEIICINDGSTDGSSEILEQYKELDNRIILLCQENCGASTAKNQGLAIATGKYFAIVDSDDILLPNAMLIMHDAINSSDADIVHGGHIIQKKSGEKRLHISSPKILNPPFALAKIMDKSIHHDPWGRLFRRSLFTDNQISWPESSRHATDVLVVYQAFHFAKSVSVIPDLVYKKITGRLGSISNNHFSKLYLIDKIQARLDLNSFIQSQGLWEKYQENIAQNNEKLFYLLLRRMTVSAKGGGNHSIVDILNIFKRSLMCFYTEENTVRTIIQILKESMCVITSKYTIYEKAQVVNYVKSYLSKLDLQKIDLTQKELQFIRDFDASYFNLNNKNKLICLVCKYYNIEIWKSKFQRLIRIV